MRMPLAGRKFRELDQVRLGLIGVVLSICLVVLALNVSRIQETFATHMTAQLSESGGLAGGDDVRVAGRNVGRVRAVELNGKHVTVTFTADGVKLGDTSRAVVKSDNALGKRYLALVPDGAGSEHTIPIDRTDPGVTVNAALGQLTSTTAQLNTAQLSTSFQDLTDILARTPREFRGALKGISMFSRTISTRDAALQELLTHASDLSAVLAKRSKQVTGIMSDGSALLGELESRRAVVQELLANVRGAADELEGLVRDNRTTLGPALQQVRGAASLLTKYRSDLDFVLKNAGGYLRSLGEAVGSGPFFQAYVQNLTAPTNLAPVIGDIVRSVGAKK